MANFTVVCTETRSIYEVSKWAYQNGIQYRNWVYWKQDSKWVYQNGSQDNSSTKNGIQGI